MPVRKGKDQKGCYYRYGSQKKYHFKCGSKSGASRAKRKAEKQGKAIRSTGWKK